MLIYGQAANNVFREVKDIIADISDLDPTAAQNAETVLSDGTGLFSSASFMALTKPEFRFYTTRITEKVAADYNEAGITATMEGGGDDLNARFVKKVSNNNVSIILEVTGITAENMDKTVTVKINALDKTLTFNGNLFAKAMASVNDADTRNHGAALYKYGVAAKACFAQESAELEAPPQEDLPTVILDELTGSRQLVNGDVVTGTTSQYISIADGATVTLRNVTIQSSYYDGITLNGNATIRLEGENRVVGGETSAGIYVKNGKTLTIEGTGSLEASCSSGMGAGIGGGRYSEAGNIIINSGTITATGHGGCAGIGSGMFNSYGNITINGGTVTAIGANDDFGEGLGGAGIGCGAAGTCGTITIGSGVTVTATKGSLGPTSIGKGSDKMYNPWDGYRSTCGIITIDPAANVTQN